MDCAEARDRLFQQPPAEPLGEDLAGHLSACPTCGEHAGGLKRLDARLASAIGAPVPPDFERLRPRLAPPRVRWTWAVAAALLLVAGLAWRLSGGPPRPSVPAVRPQDPAEASGLLELAPGASASSSEPGKVQLKAGACWVDALRPVEVLAGGVTLRLENAEAEIRLEEFPWSPLTEARAAEACVRVSVLEGEAVAGRFRIPAGFQARLSATGDASMAPLTEADRAALDAWRVRRIEEDASRPLEAGRLASGAWRDSGMSGALVAEIASVDGTVMLRYPVSGGMGETALGDLPAFRDGKPHRLALRSVPGRMEVFLDGRRLLKRRSPRPSPRGGPAGLGVEGGGLELSRLSVSGPSAP